MAAFVQFKDTDELKVTAPAAFQLMFPLAICPEPSLLSFHFVPLVIEPSLPRYTLFLYTCVVLIVQPAILLLEPKWTMTVPLESVV